MIVRALRVAEQVAAADLDRELSELVAQGWDVATAQRTRDPKWASGCDKGGFDDAELSMVSGGWPGRREFRSVESIRGLRLSNLI